MTPLELNIYIEVFVENKQSEFKTNITIAYYNAYFQRVEKMPSLSDVLSDIDKQGKENEPMTDEQLYQQVLKLHQAFGGV